MVIVLIVSVLTMIYIPPQEEQSSCKGTAGCLKGDVTKVVDGDTLEIDGTRIRLALVDTPEFDEAGFEDANNFTANLCPIGSQATVDQDDLQLEDSFGRMIAVVYCNGKNLNEELLKNGHAVILTQHCAESEFGNDSWARDYGC